MTSKRFPSKIDGWLVFVFAAAMFAQLAALVVVLTQENDSVAALIIGITIVVVVLFVGSLFRSTYYAVDGDQLLVVSGPFRWHVPIDEITSVTPTRNPLSSPALSLDRLRIAYGKKKILVSPADKAGFLRAIGHDGATKS